ncbi:helix-turn-helix domain-containing protein [Microbacterium sp. PMB16]|uniref:helix-turn-helix domain-containing protein n=1 Tax=Microbacterium sp. PMB16 TaxID=3120157 RepID=UPI003F4C07BB
MSSTIATELERIGRPVDWLAAEASIDRSVLRSKLLAHEEFTMVDLANIAAALDVPVAALMPTARP